VNEMIDDSGEETEASKLDATIDEPDVDGDGTGEEVVTVDFDELDHTAEEDVATVTKLRQPIQITKKKPPYRTRC
jgi:hypothetical protein